MVSAESPRSLSSARPTCLVVDPHPALVDLVAAELEEAGFDVVARVSTAEDALEAAARFHPKVVVGDPDLSASDGRPVLGALHATDLTMRIIAFADAAELGPAETAMLAGVDAIVAKQSPLGGVGRRRGGAPRRSCVPSAPREPHRPETHGE